LGEKYAAFRPKLEKVIQIAAFIGVAVAILSPMFQWAERLYMLKTGTGMIYYDHLENEQHNRMGDSVEAYQIMMRLIQSISALMAKIIAGAAFIYALISWDKVKGNIKGYIKAAAPLIIFGAYVAGIYIVTQIRGVTEFDIVAHFYMGESIYEFMRHPFTYFFCGMFVLSEKPRKLLMYIFTVSAMILNGASMIDKWVVANKCFTGLKGSAIFNNTNHYCYYLAVAAVCMAMLFIYEKRAVYKTFHGANLALAMAAMISADSLGPYIAVVMSLVMFAVFSRKNDRESFRSALCALGIILIINVMMSALVDTFIASIIRTFFDLGKVITDPENSDEAGSGRWELWKNAVEHIKRRPLVGCGIENYSVGGTPHNEPLQYAVNFGIPVTLLYLAGVTVVMGEAAAKRKKLPRSGILCFCCATSYLISSMLGVAIFYTTPFWYIFLGMTYAEVAKSLVCGGEKSDKSTSGEENATILKKV